MSIMCYAQVPPVFTCTKVENSGDVTLNWQNLPNGTDVFDSLSIFYAINFSGPYTRHSVITNVAANSSLLVLPSPNAKYQAYHFFGKAYYNGNTTEIATNTISSIYLNLNNNIEGLASLSWNAVANPILPTSANTYLIYKNYDTPPGNFQQLAGISQIRQFTDTISQCDDSVTYRIEISDALPCLSVSNMAKKFFLNEKPNTPLLKYVSVNHTTGNIEILWNPSSSPDVTGYEMYSVTSGTPVSIATVNGINSNFFIYTGGTPNSNSESIRIAAIDSCNKYSNAGFTHNTIFLEATVKTCERKIDLSWNEYLNLPNGGLRKYNIYCSKNNQAFELIDSVISAGYTHDIGFETANYRYYIQAVGVDTTLKPLSNLLNVSATLPQQPTKLYIKYADVASDSLVRIGFLHDVNAKVRHYRIMRAISESGPFQYIGKVDFTTVSDVLEFNDNMAFTDERSYYYQVVTVDSCGNTTLSSNIGRTIFLQANASKNYINYLNWNPYQYWIDGVRYYRIYRSMGNDGAFRPVNTIEGTRLSYQDDLGFELSKDGNYCYYVTAIEQFNSVYFSSDTTRSNRICIKQNPIMFVPNAFTPNNDGVNDEFKASLIFIEDQNFLMSIFNRWGNLVFQSGNPNDSWDGTFDGVAMPDGMYAITIRFTAPNGKTDHYSGKVVLTR